MESVNVRLPNGRRQNIKVSPNTIVIQILDEVCEKQNLNPAEYDLTFHNKILDPSSMLRFTEIPNNASLELAQCSKPRIMSDITVRLLIEDQDQKVGIFVPSTTLIEIVENLAPHVIDNLEKTILLYAQKKFSGESDLKSTTLRKLGLFKGQVTFRLRICDLDQLSHQAHVYKPMSRVHIEEPQCSDTDSHTTTTSNLISNPRTASNLIHQAEMTSGNNEVNDDQDEKKVQEANKEKEVASASEPPSSGEQRSHFANSKLLKKSFDPVNFIRQEKKIRIEKDDEEKEKDDLEAEEQVERKDVKIENEVEVNESDVKSERKQSKATIEDDAAAKIIVKKFYLGRRQALVYNKANIKPVIREETPDNFYDATLDDVRKIYSHHRRNLETLEKMPLKTSNMRQTEDYIATCTLLKTYSKSIIRICFPDQLVLQGVFLSTDLIQTVYDFVKEYLKDSNDEFQLYETPPRKDLDPKKRLYEENLIPLANIYFSGSSELKDEVKSQISDYEAADSDVLELRRKIKSNSLESVETDIPSTSNECNINSWIALPGSSGLQKELNMTNEEPKPGPSNSQLSKQDTGKVPNWFTKGLRKN